MHNRGRLFGSSRGLRFQFLPDLFHEFFEFLLEGVAIAVGGSAHPECEVAARILHRNVAGTFFWISVFFVLLWPWQTDLVERPARPLYLIKTVQTGEERTQSTRAYRNPSSTELMCSVACPALPANKPPTVASPTTEGIEAAS